MRCTRRTILTMILGAAVAGLNGCRKANAEKEQPAPIPGMRANDGLPVIRQRRAADDDGRSVQTIDVGGVSRQYVRFEPPGLDPSAPVPFVLLLHGAGSSGSMAERLYGMSQRAANAGFVVAYPDALGDPAAWNTLPNLGNRRPDDVAFLRALVQHQQDARPIDPARIFACGHSSGALMSYRLAAEASDLFAAVGIVAGSIGYKAPSGRAWTFGEPQRPVSVIHFHGTDDPLVPYNGGSRRGEAGGVLSVADSIGFWVQHDGCDPRPSESSSPDGRATAQTYSGGRDGTEVTLWTIQGGGHEWPGWAGVNRREGGSSTGLSATDLIWDFLSAHPRPV